MPLTQYVNRILEKKVKIFIQALHLINLIKETLFMYASYIPTAPKLRRYKMQSYSKLVRMYVCRCVRIPDSPIGNDWVGISDGMQGHSSSG